MRVAKVLFRTSPVGELDPEAHTHDEPENGYATVLRSLDRSRQQELAITQALEHAFETQRGSLGVDHDRDAGLEL